MKLPLVLLASTLALACGSQELANVQAQLGECTGAKNTAEAQLAGCQTRMNEDLKTIGKNLQNVLDQQAATTGVSPNPEEVRVLPDSSEPMTVAKIQLLSAEVNNKFKDLKIQLLGAIATSRKESRAEHEATQAELVQIKETTEVIGGEVSEAQALRDELAALRQARSDDRRAFQAVASKLAESVRDFDTRRINCPDCRMTFCRSFSKDVLTFHDRLLATIEELAIAGDQVP